MALLSRVAVVPALTAAAKASLACPRIWGSPSTSESRPEQTAKRCAMASRASKISHKPSRFVSWIWETLVMSASISEGLRWQP